MRSKVTKGIVLNAVAAALCLGTAHADAKWYDAVTASGYLQTSYVNNLNRPTTAGGVKTTNTGRQFDTDSNGFAINTFLLQIAKPVGDDKYGFTARLRTGQDATALTGLGGGNVVLQEGYLTYAATSKLSVIGGRFVTPLGYEVVDSVSNPNFSEGLLFFAAEPITHTGLKANYVFTDKVNATIGVVNGWDGAQQDVNTAKTLMWQVATTPTSKLAWYFQGLYGKEYADPTHSERLTLDTVATFKVTDKLSLAGQALWAQEDNSPTTGGTTHWSGLGFWTTFAWTAKCSTALRFEVLDDDNNGNRFSTMRQTVKEFTVTQKHMMTPNMGARVEYRHDWSNQAAFVKHDASAVRNQNTISADWFVTF